jgi:hypothetical protein
MSVRVEAQITVRDDDTLQTYGLGLHAELVLPTTFGGQSEADEIEMYKAATDRITGDVLAEVQQQLDTVAERIRLIEARRARHHPDSEPLDPS